MTNKYKEIKEALEDEIYFAECLDESYAENVRLELLKDILDLVENQQTEIEWLSQAYTNSLRLSTAILETANHHYAELYKNTVNTAKSEVVTEFAEKLKEEAVTRLHYGTMLELEETECVEVEEIDNILKKWWRKSDV